MKILFLTATALAFAVTLNLPANAGTAPDGVYATQQMAGKASIDRRRPRVPGGSGCDTLQDILEHPECRG